MVQIGRYEALIINGWMNIHMISRDNPCFHLADKMRELKKFTSKKIEVAIRQNVFESKKTECHEFLKKPAKIKNEITLISFSASVGRRQTFLLTNPPSRFQPTGFRFPGILTIQEFLKLMILISIVNF